MNTMRERKGRRLLLTAMSHLAKTIDTAGLDHVITSINDCGSADELAELAHNIKRIAEHLDNNELRDCYETVKKLVSSYAGIPDDLHIFLYEAIATQYKELEK